MLVSIGEASALLGVSVSTLRRWESSQKLLPQTRTLGGHRRYDTAVLHLMIGMKPKCDTSRVDVAYARVSSSEQKGDLKRQAQRLRDFCVAEGYAHHVIEDLGSGMNMKKRGLRKLLALICAGEVRRLIVTHKDRLLRFGAPLVFEICSYFGTEVIVLEERADKTFEEELAGDLVELVTVFAARVHGRRSRETRSKKKAA